MQASDVFWNRIARKYAASPVADPAAYAHTLDRTRSYLNASDQMLEVGCGTGTTALHLADAVAHITATDISSEMTKIAKEKADAAAVKNVTFAVSDTQLRDFADSGFDVVTAFSLLHLLPDIPETLSRVHEVLRPDGLFVSKTVCLAGDNLLIRMAVPVLQWIGKAPYVTFLRPEQLEAKIRAAGFEIVESGEHNKRSRGHFVVARKSG